MLARKVSLNAENSLGYGYLLHCCRTFQPVEVDAIDPGEWWECAVCEKPLLFATDSGVYLVGQNIMI